ncbi:MAG: ATP-binding cassette domain-containing protein [candidate division NC10 bacterium]|nr:ATP-binding cassette domain-containing protein [candidate division NC10 bacterium]
MAAIEVNGLVKDFGSLRAVDGISFSVKEGEIFGFLGPNGAGKSTTINILCTLLRPTSGRVWVNGHDCVREPEAVRSSIGLIFQDPTLDNELTAWENLKFHCYLYHMERREMRERIGQMLKLVGLADRSRELVKRFSGGMKRRLEIARGLLHHPQILFLDEPTLGLDPQTRDTIWDFIRGLRSQERVTMFMTTHYMEEAENCDQIAIIDQGRLIARGTPEKLKQMVKGDLIRLRGGDLDGLRRRIRAHFGLEAGAGNGELILEVESGEEFMPRLLERLGAEIGFVSVTKPSLNDVFLHLVGRRIREEGADAKDAQRQMVRTYQRARWRRS